MVKGLIVELIYLSFVLLLPLADGNRPAPAEARRRLRFPRRLASAARPSEVETSCSSAVRVRRKKRRTRRK